MKQCKNCDDHNIIQNCKFRSLASLIIDDIIIPLVNNNKNIKGEKYYQLEDELTTLLAENN
jgi:hypothetical protein